MRTRKTFIHEDGIYEGISRIPEPRESRSREAVSLDDSYDWYPEKDTVIKEETIKFESNSDVPLGEEYKLKSQVDYYNHSDFRDTKAMAVLTEEINNMVVKFDFP